VTRDESQVSVGGMLASTKFWRNLVLFDHFWDFNRLVKDRVSRRSGDHGIFPPFTGFLGLGFM
jgi:hypothetical protein